MTENTDSERFVGKNMELRPTSLHTSDAALQLARYWVTEYGGEGTIFSVDQEYLLSKDIQDGLAVERIVSNNDNLEAAFLQSVNIGALAANSLAGDVKKELTKDQKAELELSVEEARVSKDIILSGKPVEQAVRTFIRAGKKAQSALVETNLRFAHYLARESVGISHESSLKRLRESGAAVAQANPDSKGLTSGRPYTSGKRGYVGTYRPINSQRSIYASLEDRQTFASIGLIMAAKSFKPRKPNGQEHSAKFITYAAWSIQSEIQRQSENEEHNGIRLPSGRHQSINSHFWANPTLTEGLETPSDIDSLIKTSEYAQFPDELWSQYEGSVEELNDPFKEDDHAEVFADIYADQSQDVLSVVEKDMAKTAIDRILHGLEDRERGIIHYRFGLSASKDGSFEDTDPLSLDEIGDIYGISPERVRQIESKTMAKLRYPSRSSYLRPFLDIGTDSNLPFDFVLSGDQIKLPLGTATYNGPQTHEAPISKIHTPFTESELRVKQEKQSWQLIMQESWETPVRQFIEKEAPTEVVDQQLFNFIYNVVVSADSYHFQKSFAESVKTPFPAGLVKRIDTYCDGKKLSPGQLTDIWNGMMEYTYPRVRNELADDFSTDRMGQFISKLIQKNFNSIEDDDNVVTLEIPTYAYGRIGYLASGLRFGKVKIIGNTGNYVGAMNSGFSEVEIDGHVGHNAGSLMSGDAQLIISGKAGYNLGENCKDNAYIQAATALSIGIQSENNQLRVITSAGR